MPKDHTFKCGSLFSGAGGLDLGFVMCNCFSIEFAVEVLDPCAKTYAKNFNLAIQHTSSFPNTKAIYKGSVEEINFEKTTTYEIDVLLGGPPCQDFSIIRGPEEHRQGINTKRGSLYLEFLRCLSALRPKLFVFENVPGILSANKGQAYHHILKCFSECGWEIIYADIVDASALGVPQKRKRLIIIGLRKDLSQPQTTLKAQKCLSNALSAKNNLFAKYPLTPIETFEGKPLPLLEEKYKEIMSEYKIKTSSIIEDYLIINRITPHDPREIETAFEKHELILKELNFLNKKVSELNLPDGTTQRFHESQRTIERLKRIPPGENYKSVLGTPWEVKGKNLSLIYRRLHPLKPSYTIVAHGGGGTWGYHYELNLGRLTNRERARLQTFPDSFLFCGSPQEIRAQIGEAVPPLLAKRIALSCAEILTEIIR